MAFLLFPNMVSGLNITLIENTDNCIYQPMTDNDFCKSVYEITDYGIFDSNKIGFKFRAEKDRTFSDSLNILDAGHTYKIIGEKVIVTITGYKNRWANIDNVLCWGEYCEYKYAWWNSSFPFKIPINISITSGEVTGLYSINDSYGVDLGDGIQRMWGNYTANTTRFPRGYLYYNNSAQYALVNEEEDDRVLMVIDEGNETAYGITELNLISFYPLNDTNDRSNFSGTLTNNGADRLDNCAIGYCYNFSKGDPDYLDIDGSENSGHVMNNNNLNGGFSFTLWLNKYEDNTELGIFGNYLNPDWYILATTGAPNKVIFQLDDGDENLNAISDKSVLAGSWYFVAGVYNRTGADASIYIYINGELDGSDSSGTWSTMSDNGEPVVIGGYSDSVLPFWGQIDNFMVWDRQLTDDEIRAMYYMVNTSHFVAPLVEVVNYTAPANDTNVTVNVTLLNLTASCDVCRELPIREAYCENDTLVTIREVYSCVDDACNTINQTVNQYCAYGCTDNVTIYGAECDPTDFDLSVSVGIPVLVLFVFIYMSYFIFSRAKKKRKRGRY